MESLFLNIKELVQIREAPISFLSGKEMRSLPTIKNAWIHVKDGKIENYGTMNNVPLLKEATIVDCQGKIMLPSWCDSHTHIVYAGDRSGEFVDRINGMSYEEIANNGGGILNSAKKLQSTSEKDLYEQSRTRLEEVIRLGTGAVEIKSGYGLTAEAELKMLRVIKQLKENYSIPIRSTFLAAHALPTEFKNNKAEFLKIMLEEVLPVIEQESLAEYIDVFCEKDYFDVDDLNLVLHHGKRHGLVPKIHVNQFNAIGGVKVGVAHNARSVDHLEIVEDVDIEVLKNTKTMPVALPACSYFLSIPYTPGRKMIDAGLPLALATDFNPGSSPTGNMNFVVAAACIKMKLTPEEAINAATINGAYAMGLEKEVGSITKGKRANLIVTKPISSYGTLPYSFGSNLIDQVYVDGKKVEM